MRWETGCVKKAVIIGAGPAGLTAAYELLKQSGEYEVVILEETEDIGGISKTVCCDGNRMDMGGHRFFSKNSKINEWWEEMLPLQGAPAKDDKQKNRQAQWSTEGPDPEKEDGVMLLRNRVSHIYYKGKFFDYPVKMNFQTIRGMGFCLTAQAGMSFLKTRIHKLPETSLENFYINRFGKKLYQMFFESYTRKLWGRHPKEISADWGAQRVKGLSMTEIVKDSLGKLFCIKRKKVETSLIEEFRYPKYGPGQLWETVAQHILEMGGKIYRNSKVETLSVCEDEKKRGSKKYCVHKITYICEGNAQEIEADVVFSSMPIKNLICGMDQVPHKVRAIAEGLPYRDFVTTGILVKRTDLQKLEKSGENEPVLPDCWIYVQDPHIEMGRIQIFNNWSPYMVKNAEETVWLGLEYFCREGDAAWCRSESAWTEFAVTELKQMHMLKENAEILCAHCEKVKKAYPAYFDTYEHMDEMKQWLDSLSNVYCVGRNGQHRYNNMDHSMLTAMEAVRHLLKKNCEGRERIWNVNTEQTYHEQKDNV